LVPPLWHSVYRQKLRDWDNQFASEGELEIANKINNKASY